MPIKIRVAAPADLKKLLPMLDAHNAYSNLPTGNLSARTFRAAMFGKNAFVFCDVAEAEDEDGKIEVIGYAISHDSFSTDDGQRGMYLADLFVEEAWRREGAGRALIEAVSKRARQRGATHLWWTSLSQNYQARRFYKRLGATDHPVHAHAIDGPAFDRFSSKRR